MPYASKASFTPSRPSGKLRGSNTTLNGIGWALALRKSQNVYLILLIFPNVERPKRQRSIEIRRSSGQMLTGTYTITVVTCQRKLKK